MERLALLAAAGVAVLVPPVRNRVVPVTKAVGRTGLAVAGSLIVGAKGVVDAAWRGEPAIEEAAEKAESAAKRTSTRSTRKAS